MMLHFFTGEPFALEVGYPPDSLQQDEIATDRKSLRSGQNVHDQKEQDGENDMTN